MNDTFRYTKGTLPILISMPHNGEDIPKDIAAKMQPYALDVVDTDWYLDRLYRFAKDMGCFVIEPSYSRYVIDLNRNISGESLYPGQDTTELCPTSQFDRSPIYLEGCQPDAEEIDARIDRFWRPYHDKLKDSINQIKAEFGQCLLFEAHSIRSVVPRFFDGQLPDFNFGTNDGLTCRPELSELLENWSSNDYSKVLDGRFKGGYITRAYADTTNNVQTMQLELSQAVYMNEQNLQFDQKKYERLLPTLESLFDSLRCFVTS